MDIYFPYFDRKLVLTFGGGLSLSSKWRIDTWNGNSIFSYLPGAIIVSIIYYYTYDLKLDTYDFILFIEQN